MAIALDSRDLATVDQDMAADSQVFQLLTGGANAITAADFVGANQVRVNKMNGFVAPTQYKRNADNGPATQINIEKEVFTLPEDDFASYNLDQHDMEENAAATVANVVQNHEKLITIPRRDKVAIDALIANAGKSVAEAITAANVLDAYDTAEQYMFDNEVPGGYVMFVSSDFYKALKNASTVTRSFSVNQMGIQGINRTVGQLDGSLPIVPVAKSRLAGIAGTNKVNYVMVPLYAAAPVVKYEDVTIIDPSTDRSGDRYTVKIHSHYGVLVFDNAKKSILVSTVAPGSVGK